MQRRRRPRATAVVAALLLVAGLAMLGWGVLAQEPSPPPAVPSAAPPDAAPPDAEPPRSTPDRGRADAVPHLDYSAPVRIRIPRIGVDSSLVELGLDQDGVMETPRQVEKAGWFRPSPPPGIPGATVIAGHVTWDREPVVFFELGSLSRGDRVEVVREDGITTVFEVTRVGSFPKDGFPTDEVYDSPPRSELRLITCGGEYDEEADRYLDNVIVWARIVGLERA